MNDITGDNKNLIMDGVQVIDVEEDDDIDKLTDEHIDHDRSRHRTSRSHGHTPDTVKQELKVIREMIQQISEVPKPLKKANPTDYANMSFTNDITLIDIHKSYPFQT